MNTEQLKKLNDLEKEINALQERLNTLNFERFPLDYEKAENRIDSYEFKIKFKRWCKGGSYKYPEISIPLSRDQIQFLFGQHKNEIMASLYHAKTRFDRIKIQNL